MTDEVAVKFTGSIEGIQTSVTQIREFLQGLEAPIRGVRAQLGELAEAFIAAFAVEKIKQFAESMGEVGEQTERAAAILGTSTEDIGRLGLIAQMSGSSVDALRSAFSQMSLRIVEQSDQTKRALAALGLSFDSLKGKSTVEQLAILADAFAHLANGTNKTAIATALLGRAGAELIPLLNKGRDGITEVAGEADSLGIALDERVTRALAETNREFTLMSAALRGAAIQAFLPLRDAINGVVQIVIDLASAFTEAMRTGGTLKSMLGEEGLGGAAKLLVTALANVIRDMKNTWSETMYEIDAVGIAFFHLGDLVREIFEGLGRGVREFFSGLVIASRDAVAAVGLMFVNLGEVIKGAFTGNFSEAFDKMKADAASAGASIAASLKGSVSGFNFSDLKQEWDAFFTDIKTRQSVAAEEMRKNGQYLTKELGVIWRNGNRDIENENERHNKAMASPTDRDAVKTAQREIDGQIQVLRRGLEERRAMLDAEVSIYGLAQDRKFALLETETEKEYQAELALLQKKRAIRGLEPSDIQKIDNDIANLRATHRTTMLNLDVQSIQAMSQKWQDALGTITSAFNSQLRGLLAGTTSFRQAFRSMIGDILISFIQACESMGVKWLATQLGMTTASTTGASARAAAETAGESESILATIGAAVAKIKAAVGATIAGVTANQAPIVGPAAVGEGIAAGAATEAAAMAGVLAPFELGAWNIPSITPALLHPGEMVIPQRFAEGLRGNGGMGGGDVHIHYNQVGRIPQSEVTQHARALAREIGKMWNGTDKSLRPAF